MTATSAVLGCAKAAGEWEGTWAEAEDTAKKKNRQKGRWAGGQLVE
jgi:hypothetical protein